MADLLASDLAAAAEYGSAARATLFKGDCLDGMAVLPAGSVRLAVTSPPCSLLSCCEVVN